MAGGFGGPGGPGGFGAPAGGGGFGAPPSGGPAAVAGPSGPWSATDAIGFGFAHATKDLGGVLVPYGVMTIVLLIIQSIVGGLFGAVRGFITVALVQSEMDPDTVQAISALVGGGFSIVQQLLLLIPTAFATVGITRFALGVVRGEKPQIGVIFSGADKMVGMYILLLLTQIVTGLGFLLCVVPGVILGLGLSFSSFLYVDKGLAPIDAMKASWELTNGQKMNLFVLGLLCMGVFLVGAIACCVGLFVAGPTVGLALAYVYVKLQGQTPAPAPT